MNPKELIPSPFFFSDREINEKIQQFLEIKEKLKSSINRYSSNKNPSTKENEDLEKQNEDLKKCYEDYDEAKKLTKEIYTDFLKLSFFYNNQMNLAKKIIRSFSINEKKFLYHCEIYKTEYSQLENLSSLQNEYQKEIECMNQIFLFQNNLNKIVNLFRFEYLINKKNE